MATDTENDEDQPIYDDPEVDAYFKQRNKPMGSITNIYQIIGAIFLIIIVVLIINLNISFLLRNRD